MIKYDPSQAKAVTILLTILAIAVVVTVMRIHPSDQPAQASARAVVPKRSQANVTYEPQSAGQRNPFKCPKNAPADDNINGLDKSELSRRAGRLLPSISRGSVSIEPLPIRAVSSVEKNTRPGEQGLHQGTPSSDQPKPSFVLLATVKSGNGLCAVIKSDKSDAKVVGLGDTLEGGYKVKELDTDQAVLSDGEETIVARRPQS